MSIIDHKVPPDDKMTDEQLMQYESHFAVSQPFKDKARFILHKRKTKKDNCMIALTVVILILTAYLAYREFTKEPSQISTPISSGENSVNIPKPTDKTKAPQNKKDIPGSYSHSSTSTKPK